MKNVIVNMYLFWGAWRDIKTRRIKNIYLALGGIPGFIITWLQIANEKIFLWEWICGLIPGMFFLVYAKASKERVGLGDGMVLLVLANFFRCYELFQVLCIALIFMILFSVVVLCMGRIFRDCEIPFLPFLWMSHSVLWGFHYV